jgi:hypothetical protein
MRRYIETPVISFPEPNRVQLANFSRSSNTSANVKERISWRSTREGRPKSVHPVAFRQTSRYGFVNTHVLLAGLK